MSAPSFLLVDVERCVEEGLPGAWDDGDSDSDRGGTCVCTCVYSRIRGARPKGEEEKKRGVRLQLLEAVAVLRDAAAVAV